MSNFPPNNNGQALSANSQPFVLSVEQQAQLEAIKVALQLIDNAISGNEMQVDIVTMPNVTVTGVSTEATLSAIGTVISSIDTKLSTLNSKDFATQTTLAAILAKIIASPATEATQAAGNTTLASILTKIITAPATEAKQDTGNTSLANIAGKDFATQTTLTDILNKLIASPATEATLYQCFNILGSIEAYEQSINDNTLLTQAVLSILPNTPEAGLGGNIALAEVSAAAPTYSEGRVDRLSMTTDGKLRVEAAVTAGETLLYQEQSVATSMAVTALNSLADSPTNGWQSELISNLSAKATDYLISLKIALAGAPLTPKAVYVYLCPWFNDGTNWIPASSGTATARTTTQGTITVAEPHNLILAKVLNYTTAGMAVCDNFLVSNVFGNMMPDGFQVLVFNDSGVAISASGNTLFHKALNIKQA